jgi:hypothetical protein
MGLSREIRELQTEWDLHEKTDLLPLEFTAEVQPSLFGIEDETAQNIVAGLSTAISERQILKNAYFEVIELEINAENLPTFKELRLKFVKIRTSIEKWHKVNKALYLAGGRFVDAIKNKEIAETEEIESKLLEAEKFFERQEKAKAKELNNLRISKISPWVENAEQMDFKEFSDEDFDDFVFGKKVKHEQRLEAEKLEVERIENEQIEKEKEIEAQRIENLRLKAEAEATAKKIEAERVERERLAKIESDKLAAERAEQAKAQAVKDAETNRILKESLEVRAKLEAERLEQWKKQAIKDAETNRQLKAVKDAEIVAKLEAERLAKAPVKIQLTKWVDSFEIPYCTIENATRIEIAQKFESFKKWAKLEIEKL